MPKQIKKATDVNTAESFVGSIFKFSISTVVSLLIYAVATLVIDILLPDQAIRGEINQFTVITNSIMTITVLGLDQSYIRFFNEPPGKSKSDGLFRLCFYLSVSTLVIAGIVCSLFFRGPLHSLLEFKLLGSEVVPLLFINALFYMVARYFYVLYRMEQNLKLYTAIAIAMNLFYKLFHLLGAFFKNQLVSMVVCSMLGLGALAIFCVVSRHKLLRPHRGDVDKDTLKAIMPFGLAVAPTAVMVVLNQSFPMVYVASQLGGAARGIYSYGNLLSNIITAVQLGFASFWAAYMYANYKTQQARIKKVHDYLNLLILGFFTLVVAFEDVLFWVLRNSKEVQIILPLMMLSAVFTVLCETTVYGNTIAKRPIFDTIGNALSIGGNILLLYLLVPRFELIGAAIALTGANFVMFLFRTLTAQHFYSSIAYPAKTAVAVAIAIGLGVAGTWLHNQFLPRLAVCGIALLIYCLLYRKELMRFVQVGLTILKTIGNKITHRG